MQRNRQVLGLLIVLSLFGLPGCFKDVELIKHINNLRDDDAEERHDAAKALEDMGTRAAPAVKVLGDCLNDTDDKVRYRAAKALCKIGLPAKDAAEQISIAAANDPNDKVTYYCAKTLEDIADQDPASVSPHIDNLVKALDNDNPKTRYYLVKTLGEIGPQAMPAKQAVEQLVEDDDEKVRMAAESALKRIDKKSS